MYYEITTIGVLVMMIGIHWYLRKRYEKTYRQTKSDIDKVNPDDLEKDDSMEDIIMERTRVLIQIRTDNDNNMYAFIIHGICVGGLSILVILNILGLTEAVGWMSLALLPLPLAILCSHIRHIPPFVKWYGTRR